MRNVMQNKMFLGKIKALIFPTEDMSQHELSMALNKIIQKLKINNSYDVPYLAGYSHDGKTIYIDRRLPKYIVYKSKKFNIHRFLVLHEIVEKALIDHLGRLHYQLAHEIASRAEYAAILGENFSYRYYNRIIQEKLIEIRQETNYCIPHDLDLKPYLDSKDIPLIKRIHKSLSIKWTKVKNKNLKLNYKHTTVTQIIKPSHNFPNNIYLPVIVYKQVLMLNNSSVSEVKQFLRDNGWKNIWVNGMFSYDHYHSNTHEALVIYSGQCRVQIGGPHQKHISVTTGDVIFFPAGVAHKKIEATDDFVSIGCYPYAIQYDVNLGKAKEHPLVDINLSKVKLPKKDPIFGRKGPLLKLWNRKASCK